MSEGLYFIAILPSEDAQKKITDLKHLVKEKFGSQHALNAPPHITLHMPFKWKDKKLNQLTALRSNINKSLDPFEVELKNFDFFEPRVVFLNVIENAFLSALQGQVLKMCRRELKLENGNYKNHPFHPHVTIAFRDLKKAQFYEASDYFKNRAASFKFQAEKVELLKHDGKNWQVF